MSESRFQRFFGELKRRKVIRTAGAYLVIGWAAIEVAETVAPLLELPIWVPRLVLFLVVLGFPLAVGVAWAFDVTPEGMHRTPDRDAAGASGGAVEIVVTVAALAAVAAGAWYLAGPGWGGDAAPDRSIAVLPFETLGAADPSAFTEGIHAGILTRLSNVAELDVISRTSVLRYRSGDTPLRAIADELGVAWVVRGEVQESGDQVLVNVRLADARRDRQVWAEAYRRDLTAENVFQIQGDIAHTIIQALQGHLAPGEERRVERMPTRDLQAYRLYVQGRRLLEPRDEGMSDALTYFRRAVAADSSFALAWVGVADALTLLTSYGYREPGDTREEVERSIDRALEIDPDLAEAHASLGLLHESRRRGPDALAALDRALGLRPSYGEALNWKAWLNLLMGNEEAALESARRTMEIDPLHREGLGNLITALIATGAYGEAAREAERAREVYPAGDDATVLEGVALYHDGQYDRAREALRSRSVPWTGAGEALTLGLTQLAQADTAAAEETLAGLESQGSWFAAGVLLAALDRREDAFAAFDRVEDWSAYWPTLSVHHFYPAVWSRIDDDPRYDAIVRRVRAAWRR